MTGSDGKSNFENAIEEAGKYIEGASRGTAFSLILGGPVPEILTPVPVSDRRVLRDTLQQLRPSQGTMRATSALTAAAFTLAYGNNPVKQIVVVGDGHDGALVVLQGEDGIEEPGHGVADVRL